jgi:Tfp pilus assembly protein PilE
MNTRVTTSSIKCTTATQGHQGGNALLFLMLGLVVTAVMTIVGFNMYSDSQRKVRIEAASSEITTMISSAQKLYGNANQYGAVTTAIAIRSGVIPPRMRLDPTSLQAQNRYYGAVTMAPATITTANDSLTLTYGAANKDDCQDLVMNIDPMVRRIAVAGTEVKAADATVNIATMSTACDAASARDIAFTFGRGQ